MEYKIELSSGTVIVEPRRCRKKQNEDKSSKLILIFCHEDLRSVIGNIRFVLSLTFPLERKEAEASL